VSDEAIQSLFAIQDWIASLSLAMTQTQPHIPRRVTPGLSIYPSPKEGVGNAG
jgi:hypothetical protein